jgi:hypothetical protein
MNGKIYCQKVPDNGPKWGSFVGKKENGIFNFDKEMKEKRPVEWEKMMAERLDWLKPVKKEICSTTQYKPLRRPWH